MLNYKNTLNINYTKLINSLKNQSIIGLNYDLLITKIQNNEYKNKYENVNSFFFLPFDNNRNWDQSIEVYKSIDEKSVFIEKSKITLEYLLSLKEKDLGLLLIESRIYQCLQVGDRIPEEYEKDESENYIFKLAKTYNDKEIISNILSEL
jgi:hypothetical protein